MEERRKEYKNFCEDFKGLHKRLDRVDDKQDKIYNILLGNGKLGLVAKVTVLWGISLFALVAAGTALARAIIK